MKTRHACLVYNPTAGRYPSGLLAQRAANLLREKGWDVLIRQSQSGQHITELAHESSAQDLEALFVMGGDGTINHAIPGLMGSTTALGVLPAGTSNVWAQELGLTVLGRSRRQSVEESARCLSTADIHPVDIGMCNDRPFLLWAGVGLDAFIIHRLEPRSRWDKYLSFASYAIKAAWNARQWHGINLNFEVDGEIIRGRYLMGVVSNVRRYAGGLAVLSPKAYMDDGILDLWLFKGEDILDTLQAALDLVSGRHVHSDKVQHIPFRNLHLEGSSPIYVQVDGEPYSSSGGIDITIRNKALNVLIPDHAPALLLEKRTL